MMWTGLGRWVGKQWKPYLESDNHEIDLATYKHKVKRETLWFFGDSTNNMFAKEYYQIEGLCGSIWKKYVDILNLQVVYAI